MMQPDELIDTWLHSAELSMSLHYKSAQRFERMHYLLGVPAVVLSTAVGTTVFAALRKDLDVPIQIATAAGSFSAAILTALQTFLGYNQRAVKHQQAGAAYASLIRRIHEQLAFPASQPEELQRFVAVLRARFDTLSRESPAFPQRLFQREMPDT